MARRTKSNYNSMLIEALSEKPIAFNPMLARVVECPLAGLFLSQLLYWDGKGSNKDWIYKTISEVQAETCMNRSQQDRAIKIWKEYQILEVELRGIPRRRYFHINKDKLVSLLEAFSGKRLPSYANKFAETSKQSGRNLQTNTERTSDSTNKDSPLTVGHLKEVDWDKLFKIPKGWE